MNAADVPASSSDTLTVQELEAAYLTEFDLGPGYPQLPTPDFVRQLYLDDLIEDLSLRFPPFWTTKKQERLDWDLEQSVRTFLGIPSRQYHALRTTFSGSVALDRALSAILRATTARGLRSLDVITTTPCIDIMRLFLEERHQVRPLFVKSRRNGSIGALDGAALTSEVAKSAKSRPKSARLILISSPENPTGSYWTTSQLREIVQVCIDHDAFLLVDHTFVVAGLHTQKVPRIWDVAPQDLNWMAMWDTGKTFGLNEDKLGFLITGNRVMTRLVDEAIAVLQFGVARRQKLFFSELLRQADYHDHLGMLRDVCITNYRQALGAVSGTDLNFLPVHAGSLALLDCASVEASDETLRARLLDVQVGVIAGNVFFHDEWKPDNYLRIALARMPQHFSRGLERLLSEISETR